MSLLTPPRKKRIKRVYRHPNLLFQKWLQEWYDEAKAKESQMKFNYARAIKSLKAFPLPLHRGADCKVLSGFGDKICQQIERRQQKHIEEFGPIDWEQYHQVIDHSGPRKKRAKKRPTTNAESYDPDDPDEPHVVNHPAPRKKYAKKKTSTHTELIDPDDPDEPNNESLNSSRKRGSRPYVPAVRSGAYAIIMAFHQAAADEGFPDHLKRAELIEFAQEFCDASFTQAPDGSHYTAFSSMSTLIKKNLISKEGSPARYALTVSGEELCARLVSAEDGSKTQVHISQELERQGTAPADNLCEDPVEQGLRKNKKAGNSKKTNRSITNQKSKLVNTEENIMSTMLSSNGSSTVNAQNDWSYSDPEDLQENYSNSIHEESVLQKNTDDIHEECLLKKKLDAILDGYLLKKNPDAFRDECLLKKNPENKQTEADCRYTVENSPKHANEPSTRASESFLEEFGNCSLTDSPHSQSSIGTCENRLTINISTNEDRLQTSDLDITVNTEKFSSEATSNTFNLLPGINDKITFSSSCNRLPCTESQSSIPAQTSSSSSSSTKQRSRDGSDISQFRSSENMSYTLQSEIENLSLINNNVSGVLKPKNTNICENAIDNKGKYNRGKYLNGWITVQNSYLQGKSSRSSTCLKSENGEVVKENENREVVKEVNYSNSIHEESILQKNKDDIHEEYLNKKKLDAILDGYLLKKNENREVVKEDDPDLENETKEMMMMMNTKNRKYERKDRMEGTHKYKKYRGKNEKRDFRKNDYMSDDVSKPNKQFSSKTKRRRKRKKSESSSEEESIDVVPEIMDDPKQPQPSIVPPIKCSISTTNWKNFVFFDLETTSLRLDCDIVQIAAIDGFTNDTFDLYVKPTKKMDKMASFITKISYKKGILRHNFKPVYANPAPKALEKFLFWIQQRSPVTLVAHNASFDSKRLFYALNLHRLTAEYKKHTIGFVDTLPLFQKKYPHLPNHKQETLVKHILNIEYDAHNALEDVKSLKDLYNNTFLDNSTPNLEKSSTDFASAHEQWLYEWEGKKRATTFAEMLSKKCVSDKMIDKMANSGLTKGNLEFVYKSKGVIGIENLLGKIGANGKPRVTSNTRVINDIVKYFTLKSD